MTFLARIDTWIARVERTIVSSCMIIMAAILLVAVVFRHLNIVMVGGEEIAQFTVVWLTFWGMAIGARKGSHILMSAVLERIPPPGHKKVVTGLCLVSGLFCLILSGYAFQLTYNVFSRGQVSPALRIPIGYMYVSAPFGFFLTGIYYLGGFLKNINSPKTFFGLETSE